MTYELIGYFILWMLFMFGLYLVVAKKDKAQEYKTFYDNAYEKAREDFKRRNK
jgi:hypothetical protein